MAADAVIVIDMLNPYQHEDAEPLMHSVSRILDPLRNLIGAARDAELPIVYVNDNHGDWTAGPRELAEHALAGAAPELVEPVLPPPESPFVVKARHSIFYETLLEYLLRREEVGRLILAGQVTEQCILYSALDGYVRHFDVVVARDCVAHIDEELARSALAMMETNMHAHIVEGEQAVRTTAR